MIALLRFLAHSFRRFFAQRSARRLIQLNLPKGLPPGLGGTLRTALRVPPRLEAPEGEYWTLPLAAQTIRGQAPARLLHFPALPRPPRRLDVVWEPRALVLPRAPSLPSLLKLVSPLKSVVRELGVVRARRSLILPPVPRLPTQLRLARPLGSALRDLGVARLALFRLDEELRLPFERDPMQVFSDAPTLATPCSLPSRLPLARASLSRVDPRAYRIDPRTFAPANENATGLKEPYGGLWWVSPKLRREKVDLPWMAKGRIAFISPVSPEWFALWWEQTNRRSPGARQALETRQPQEVYWAMEHCKEQMLIRRDVEKDENAPTMQEFFIIAQGVAARAYEPEDLGSLIPAKQWVGISKPLPQPPVWDRPPRDAYLQWRTLMDGLEER